MNDAEKGVVLKGCAGTASIPAIAPTQCITLREQGWTAKIRVIDSPAHSHARLQALSAWIHRLLERPFDLPGFQVLKHSESVEVIRAALPNELGGADVICKRNRAGSTLFFLRSSRAARNFQRAEALLKAGICTPLPLAVISTRGQRGESILVTEFVSDLVDLDRIAMLELPRLEHREARVIKQTLGPKIAELFARLDAGEFHHRDLKASNIPFTHWRSNDASICLVDLDGLQRRRFWNGRDRMQPLIRLAASLRGYKAITRTDMARVLRQYLILTGRSDASWKEIFFHLARRVARYVDKAKQRKFGKLDQT